MYVYMCMYVYLYMYMCMDCMDCFQAVECLINVQMFIGCSFYQATASPAQSTKTDSNNTQIISKAISS